MIYTSELASAYSLLSLSPLLLILFSSRYTGWQPTPETHSLLMIDNVPYNKLNTVYIQASKNNTILTLTDCNGITMFTTSAVI